MTYDASNRKQIRIAEKAAAIANRDRIEFLTAAMSTIQGRTWFHTFLADCHIFSDPFSGNPYQEAYLKGERNVGLRIFAEISANCPDQYITMIREANDRDRTVAEQLRSQDSRRDVEGRPADDLGDPDDRTDDLFYPESNE